MTNENGYTKLDNGVVGVLSTFSYVWIVPSEAGVILIDAGNDPGATSVLEELGRRGLTASGVQAVLITHAHFDHYAGIQAFQDAALYVMSGDLALFKERPAHLKEISGNRLTIGKQSFDVLAIPGHTRGSAAFVWNGTCFVGDVIARNEGGMAYGPDHHSESPEQNRDSVATLLKVPFVTIATGHGGVFSRNEFERFLSGSLTA